MKIITYLSVLFGLFVFAPVRAEDIVYNQLIDLEAHSGNEINNPTRSNLEELLAEGKQIPP